MKKKKKTLHLRKIRVRSLKKRNLRKSRTEDFTFFFHRFFRRRKILHNKRRNFATFLNRFIDTNFHKIYNFTKIFGLSRKYKINNFRKKSLLSYKLRKKFKLQIKKRRFKFQIKNKLKEIKLIRLKYSKKFKKLKSDRSLRSKNIKNKKKMCLYFSYRHMLCLPVRGQRTKTNAKTRKDFAVF